MDVEETPCRTRQEDVRLGASMPPVKEAYRAAAPRMKLDENNGGGG